MGAATVKLNMGAPHKKQNYYIPQKFHSWVFIQGKQKH